MTHAELVRARFGFDGGELIGHGRVQPEGGSGSYAEGPVFWEVCAALAAQPSKSTSTPASSPCCAPSTVADVGKAINPQLVARQDEGATLQGLGNAPVRGDALRAGRHAAERHPAQLPNRRIRGRSSHHAVLDSREWRRHPGPFGAKGCGEGALAAVPAAVVNALADAGVPMTTLPLPRSGCGGGYEN